MIWDLRTLPEMATVAASTLAMAVALAACAGLRAWLPLLLAGILSRAGILELGPSYHFLSSTPALVLFALATLIEVVGDKFPAVDHALDVISTILRPLAGALLAASVLGRITDPRVSLVLGLVVGAPSALVPHTAKAGLRAVTTATTAGLANPLLSLLEDAFTVVLFLIAMLVPVLVAAALLVTAILIARRLVSRRPQPQVT
jgi:hypothetical protein